MNKRPIDPKQQDRRIHAKFALIMLLSAAGGAVFGFLVIARPGGFVGAIQAVSDWLLAAGLYLFAAGLALLAVGSLFLHRAKGFAAAALQTGADDAFDSADRCAGLAMTFSGAGYVWLLLCTGLCFNAHIMGQAGAVQAMMVFVMILVQLVWTSALQAGAVKLMKRLCPEKRGNVFDTKFQKEWYASCDEAERARIAESSYFSFKVMNVIYPFAMLAIILVGAAAPINALWYVLVGGLWLVHQLTYLVYAYKLEHGHRK